jgi:glucoamylase
MALEGDEGAKRPAPGGPGVPPTWTSSAKDVVGCALGSSRVWFTVGFGVLNEVYHPRVDNPQIRDLGFIVADGKGFWVEVKRLNSYRLRMLEPGVPAVEVIHHHERFELKLVITPDPIRDVLLVDLELTGDEDLAPYALVAPRLGATGAENCAKIECRGLNTILTASKGEYALCLAAVRDQEDAIDGASAGYVGASDGWQDFSRNGRMTAFHTEAGPGNVAMMAKLSARCTLALGFALTVEGAATLALSSLMQPFELPLRDHIEAWREWHRKRAEGSIVRKAYSEALENQFALSAMVLRTHRDKTYPGTMVASLSVPWGNSGDNRGGYHLIWPRDMVGCASALLALGADSEARVTLRYLMATQRRDGSWNQNQWLDGSSYWTAIQLDEIAAPVLLAAALAERDALKGICVGHMVRRALTFIALNGPATMQDRWEENAGVNCYTLACCVCALVAGAELLTDRARAFALELADFWNARVEAWTSVRGAELDKRHGVAGHFVRIAPVGVFSDDSALASLLDVRNRDGQANLPAEDAVSTDFLQLVRFGLRRADNPLVLDTVKLVDDLLKVDTPCGPAWHRYNNDGYGEGDDGSPFRGSGRGRAWPLLTGERGHYELAAGRDALPYLDAMSRMTGPCGMIPEQIWDAEDIPELYLFKGKPSGSAMPLAWAHAEYIKLMASIELGRPFDRPKAAWERYRGERPILDYAIWTPHAPIAGMKPGQTLVVALPGEAVVMWGFDDDRLEPSRQCHTKDTDLGLHVARLTPPAGPIGRFVFTWRELVGGRESEPIEVRVADGAP